MRRCLIPILFVFLSQSPPGAIQAQTVAVLDATRHGAVFNLVNGTATRGMRQVLDEVFDSIVALDSLVDLDADTQDVVILHNGFDLSSPMPTPLSEEEQQALRDFVEEGGATLVAADTYGGADSLRPNSILAPFNVVLDGFEGGGYVRIQNPGDHPVTAGQTTFRTDRPSWFTDLGPCATSLVSLEPPGGPVLAVIDRDALTLGSGRVVLTSDANWIGDANVHEILYFQEHETLFLNMLEWLLDDRAAPLGHCDDDGKPTPPAFRRGDCNGDGAVNISDATCILNWLFAGGETPGCVAATNTNGDPAANIADATYLLNFLFAGGSAPVAPFPDCDPGTLPADAQLGCADASNCQ